MLGHCLRRWPNIEPVLDQFLVYTGMDVCVWVQPTVLSQANDAITGNKSEGLQKGGSG